VKDQPTARGISQPMAGGKSKPSANQVTTSKNADGN